MQARRHLMVLLVVLLAQAMDPADAAERGRVVPIEGQVGPYWEQQDLHVAGNTLEGAVVLRANETLARVDLTIEDRSVGSSAGYVVRFCGEPCPLSGGPYLARSSGPGPFALSFSLRDVDVLHYRVSVDEGVRLDAHVSGVLVLDQGNPPDAADEVSSATQAQAHTAVPWPSILLGVGVVGLILLSPWAVPGFRRWLVPAPLAGLFTRPETLLGHPTRKRIHDLVRENPGIHLRELRRKMSMPPGQVDHHLRKLVQGGYVITVASRGYTAHFLPGTVDRELMEALAGIKSDVARALLSLIAEGRFLTLGTAANRMGIAISTASYHLGSLERLGLVTVRDGANRGWRATRLGRSFLALVGTDPSSGSRNGPETA